MLCVNEVEACALAGTETFEADAVLTLLHEKYPQTRLLLTAGSAGSYYLDAERRLFVPCEKVQAVDTTAAGDTYSGYFLAGLCRAAQRCSGIHPGNQRVEMNDTEGHVDILVCMAGTGGTGFGTASYLRSRNPNLQVVLVQPHPDSRLTPEHPGRRPENQGKNIVVIVPDNGMKYLSTPMYQQK